MRVNRFVMILIMVLTGSSVGHAFQAAGGREGATTTKSKDANKPKSQPKSGKKKPVPKSKNESTVSEQTEEKIPARQPKRDERIKEVSKPLVTAEVTFNVSPSDSVVQFEGEEFQRYAQNGMLNVKELKPGSYNVRIRRSRYREQTIRLQLQQGVNSPVNVSLVPLNGLLRVTTNVNGATIIVKDHGTYSNIVDNLFLSPGKYQIEVAKSGYETVSREVDVYPDETTIEPVTLERKRPPRTGDTMNTRKELAKERGETYWIIELTGTSGDVESKSGNLSVLIMPNDKGFPGSVNVMRMLNGMPCRVYPIPLDNIKNIVITSAPGETNQWGKILISIYPKNSKARVRFDIGWQSIDISSETTQSEYGKQSGVSSYPWDPLESTCRHASLSIL